MDNKIGSSPIFGMALHMPSSKSLTRKFGEKIGEHVNKLRPALEDLSKDADIYVKPSKYWFDRQDKSTWSLATVVLPKANPVINKIKAMYHFYTPFRTENFASVSYGKGKKFTNRILESITKVKNDVIKLECNNM